jgi:hypothetical protein
LQNSATAGQIPAFPASPCHLAHHHRAIEAPVTSPSLTLIRFSPNQAPLECHLKAAGAPGHWWHFSTPAAGSSPFLPLFKPS